MKRKGTRDLPARWFGIVLCASACLTPELVLGANDVLIRGHDGVVVTTEDILADAERIPDELRAAILASPVRIEQLATNVYVHRVLAKRAQEAGLQNGPRVIAAQQLATDKILSDAFIAKAIADAQPASEEALEAMARAAYAVGDGPILAGEERRVSHILIAKKVENARARADEVLAKLRTGADLAALAKEISDDPGSRQKGGDLGLVGRGRTVKPFEDAVFGLAKPGDLAGPVETEFGFHIVRLEEIRAPGKKPYEGVSAEIKRGIQSKMVRSRRDEIVARILAENKEIDTAAIESFARQKR